MKGAVRSGGRVVTVEDMGLSVAFVAATAADYTGTRACVAMLLTPAEAHALAAHLTACATLAEQFEDAAARMAEAGAGAAGFFASLDRVARF